MTEQKKELVLHAQQTPQTNMSVFSNTVMFEQAQRFASALCKSDIVPKAYQNNIANTLVALEMAHRMGESPLMIMQHLDIIHGKPSFGSKFIIARLNTCGQFSPLRFTYEGEGDNRQCKAHAFDMRTQEQLVGPPVSIAMAKKEGWYGKPGSKWPTMPELMLMYRAGTFFGRMYSPELSMGMQTSEELFDIGPTGSGHEITSGSPSPIQDLNTTAKEQSETQKKSNSRGKKVEDSASEATNGTPQSDSPTPDKEDLI